MKFKLRVMDAEAQHHQNQIYHSQSSSSSSPYTYFTEQPIRAGFPTGHFSGGHGGPEMFRECFDMRDAIHRELEKERIREAIIAEEMARKRILEEEVRHELIMEREMRTRTGGGLYFPVPLPPTHNHLLEPVVLHRQPIGLEERIIMSIEEKNSRSGGEIRVLDSSVTGAKRKQAPPVTGESSGSGSHSNTSKRRISEEWSCAICQVTATSERGLTEHLQGKKHQLKEAALIAKKTGACHGLGVSTKKPVVKLSVTTVNMSSGGRKSKPKKRSSNQTSSSTNETSTSTNMLNESKKENVEKKKDKFKFWCEMCKVGAYCEKVMNNHKEGKKHSVNLVKLLQKGKPELPFDVKENTQVAGEDELKSDTEEEGDE